MSPNNGGPPRFALLASGARFSCALLQALLRRNCRPALLMLPGYAPAELSGPQIEIASGPGPPLLRLADGIEIAYAPPERQREAAALIGRHRIDFLLVACWPYLIGSELVGSAANAALNLHPSLLPKHRGPDPLQQQLTAGDDRFGVTLHLLDERFDHGDIVAQAELGDCARVRDVAEMEWRCAELGALLFTDALQAWPEWIPVPQAGL